MLNSHILIRLTGVHLLWLAASSSLSSVFSLCHLDPPGLLTDQKASKYGSGWKGIVMM